MISRPIIFSAEMVKAILEGRKTQTRRIVKPQPREGTSDFSICKISDNTFGYNNKNSWGVVYKAPKDEWIDEEKPFHEFIKSPYGFVGDRLWVREICNFNYMSDKTVIVKYKDLSTRHIILSEENKKKVYPIKDASKFTKHWCQPIFMPQWASRITLEITDIRVERINDISEDDAKNEGVLPKEISHQTLTGKPLKSTYQYRNNFKLLWNKINGKTYPWESNPLVWVVEFKVIENEKK